MLEDNKVFKMNLCGDIEDGLWTDWDDWGECEEFEMVGERNYTCGKGLRLLRRNCRRTLGGRNCLNPEGLEVVDQFMITTTSCLERPCPGIINTAIFRL